MTDPPLDRAAVVTVPVLLSIATAAEILDVSPRTLRRRIADGTMPAVVEHGRLMIRGDELRDYIDALKRPGAARLTRRPARKSADGRFDFLRQ